MSTVFALIARIHGTYANRNIMADTYALIVLKGEEMKQKKPNFWRLLPKLSIVTSSIFSVYIAHRECAKTGSISGYSFVVPLAIVIYYVITQAVECVFEGKRKD